MTMTLIFSRILAVVKIQKNKKKLSDDAENDTTVATADSNKQLATCRTV